MNVIYIHSKQKGEDKQTYLYNKGIKLTETEKIQRQSIHKH
jgi:hypothetical protein